MSGPASGNEAWHLLGEEVVLGTFTVEQRDQPWLQGPFESTPAFEPYRPLFEAAWRTLQERPWDWIAFDAAHRPIRDLDLRMEQVDGSEGFDEMLLSRWAESYHLIFLQPTPLSSGLSHRPTRE